MNSTTVAIDLAKNVFELAVAGADWRIGERHRLSRAKFAQFFVNRPVLRNYSARMPISQSRDSCASSVT
jgi:hypothetical protein